MDSEFNEELRDIPIPTGSLDPMNGELPMGMAKEIEPTILVEGPLIYAEAANGGRTYPIEAVTEACDCHNGECKPEITNFQAFKMLLNFLCVRRLAIKPPKITAYSLGEVLMTEEKSIMLFQWQKMPDGYRWF